MSLSNFIMSSDDSDLPRSLSLEDELAADLLALKKGGSNAPRSDDVGRCAYQVKTHTGFLRSETKQLLIELGFEAVIRGNADTDDSDEGVIGANSAAA